MLGHNPAGRYGKGDGEMKETEVLLEMENAAPRETTSQKHDVVSRALSHVWL